MAHHWLKPRRQPRAPAWRRGGHLPGLWRGVWAPERRYRPVLLALEDRALPSFVSAATYTAGTEPRDVAVGDFTGSGILDLAVANRTSSGTVSVLLGNGDGSFQPPHSFATAGSGPVSVVVGDFNGDGIPDLAAANSDSNTVSVLLGNGDGSFQPAHTFATGGRLGAFAYPNSLAVGDFTGSGILDLAVANHDSGTVGVLLGNGDGSFEPARTFAAGSDPAAVAVGAFTGAGALDLVVVDTGPRSTDDRGVSVLLGNGDGSFQDPRRVDAGSNPVSIAVGDFTGDGILDLAVGNAGRNAQVLDSRILMLQGNGDGTFQPARTFATGGLDPTSLAVGDFTGAGVLDLAVANQDSNAVSVLLGNGDGSFQPTVNYTVGLVPLAVATGDFTGAGRDDLAVAYFGIVGDVGDSGVSVLLSRSDGSMQAARNYIAGFDPMSVAVGDLTGDGIPDLVTANFGIPAEQVPGTVSVLLGNGDGTFRPAQSLTVGFGTVSVAVGNFTGDGVLDLAVANDDADLGPGIVKVLLGNGDGTFRAAPDLRFANEQPVSLVVADLNGDGRQDLVVTLDSGDVDVLLSNGDGTFQAPRTVASGGKPALVADFDGDGTPDLAVLTAHGMQVLLGNGDGSFRDAGTFATGANLNSFVAAAGGDVDGDGFPDLAVVNDGVIRVFLGNGDGTFRPAQTFAAPTGPIVAGDFNGDGFADLAVAEGFTEDDFDDTVSVFLGNGDGTFQPARTFAAGDNAGPLAAGDFSGSGLPGLAVADTGDIADRGGITVLLNDGLWDAGNGAHTGRPLARRPAPPDPAASSPSPALFADDGGVRRPTAPAAAASDTVMAGTRPGPSAPPLAETPSSQQHLHAATPCPAALLARRAPSAILDGGSSLAPGGLA